MAGIAPNYFFISIEVYAHITTYNNFSSLWIYNYITSPFSFFPKNPSKYFCLPFSLKNMAPNSLIVVKYIYTLTICTYFYIVYNVIYLYNVVHANTRNLLILYNDSFLYRISVLTAWYCITKWELISEKNYFCLVTCSSLS